MPYRKKRGRRHRGKKRSFKRHKTSHMNVLVNRGPAIVPDRYLTKLRFADTLNISTGSTGNIRANSLFDPDGGPAQPLGFDQLAELYDRYKVGACSIKITVMNHLATQLQFALYPQVDNTVPTNWDEAATQPYAKTIFCGGIGSGQAIKHVSMYITTKAIRGQRLVSTESLGAAVTASLVFLWFWRYLFEPLPIITGAVDFTLVFEMQMYTAFYRRAALPESLG